ncbi:MAG TPA: chemotaxis protein CheW [Actinomycetes bacterium]|nr:chemotaxis protein CheW [Actinomycetes bacterium]
MRQSPTSGAVAVREAGRRQLVVLRLGDREYGLATEVVVQVLRMVAVRPVPESPPWIAGVVNLRGRTTPMVDLRRRLGLPARAPGPADHIVVVRSGDATLGLIVDAVLEVLEVGQGEVEPPADAAGPGGVIAAVARAGDRLILVLDVDRLDDRGHR